MNSVERSVIVPVTLGSVFEWFEVFLYIYWAPLMIRTFNDLAIPLVELIHVVLVVSTGLVARPIGGLLFGYVGDRFGRKAAFLLSIVCITLPSFAIAFMPTFESWAYAAVIYVGVTRFIQGVPAGGELPGALCLLSESAEPHRRRYICSYWFVGPQIGQILSMFLCLVLQQYLSHEQLLSWGWRLSFFVSGLIGVAGFFFRRILHESAAFARLKTEHRIEHHPFRESFRSQKKNMTIAFFLSLFEVVGFFLIYFYILENPKVVGLQPSSILLASFLLLTTLTISMPIFGKIPMRFRSIFLLRNSAVLVLILSPVLYMALAQGLILTAYILIGILIVAFTVQFSILPSFLAEMFPARVRFTCLGFSFNIADGVIGGVVPFLGTWLTIATGSPSAFALLFSITAVLYLAAIVFLSRSSHRITV